MEQKTYTLENTPEKYQNKFEPMCTKESDEKVVDDDGKVVIGEDGKPVTKKVPAEFAGYVIVACPDYDERSELAGVGEMKIGKDESPEELAERAKKLTNRADFYRRLVKRIDPYVLKVEITRLSDGFVFDCLEDLRRDTDMQAALQEIGIRLVGKMQVGNGSTSKK